MFPRPSICALAAAICFAAGEGIGAARGEEVDFNRDIQPILSENCFQCHGPDKAQRKADLRLDQEKEAKADHDGSIAIVPGKSAESELVRRIFTDDPDDVMPTPKSNRKLTTAQKDLLKRWIDEGAKWGVHWAFIAPQKPPVPSLSNLKFPI